jgi:hypothetical protein
MNTSPITSSEQIKVLLVFANPRGTDSLQLGREERAIRESIQLSTYREKIAITTCHAATIHDFRRALLANEFQIIHISGHGSPSNSLPGSHYGVLLENEIGERKWVSPTALAELLQAYTPPIQCVLLNACDSIYSGQIMSQNFPFVIAMEGPISDQAAIEFSRGFYDAVGTGRTIDFAYEEGCRTVNLTVPNASFHSQLFAQNSRLRSFALQDYQMPPVGYACIYLPTVKVAIKPIMYQSLQILLNDIYINYLTERYKPYSYGSDWVLVSDTWEPTRASWEGSTSTEEPHSKVHAWWPRGYRRLAVPWNWQLPENKGKSVDLFDANWGEESLQSFGIEPNSYWTVMRPETRTMGLATNHQNFAEGISRLFHHNPVHPKGMLWRWRGRLVPATTFQPNNYSFLFVLTDHPEAHHYLWPEAGGYYGQASVLEVFEKR